VLYNFRGSEVLLYIMLYGGGGCQKINIFVLYTMWTTPSAVRIVFFCHFESNQIVELLFEISNRIVIVGLKSHQ